MMTRHGRARHIVSAACAALLALTLAACAPQSTQTLDTPAQVDAALPDATQAQLQAAVDRAIAASGSTGAVVGVWVPWAGTWLQGAGTLAPGGSATTATATFKAGPVTRAMTCDVLYGMVEAGTVALADSVTKYVSGLSGGEAITLGELCNSTSGLASYSSALAGRFIANPERVWNPRELISYGDAATKAQPGAAFADSDTGYVLLGLALERASGRPAADLLEEYAFQPAGMDASALPATAAVDLRGLWAPTAADGTVACTAPIDVTDLSPSAGYTAAGVEIGRAHV